MLFSSPVTEFIILPHGQLNIHPLALAHLWTKVGATLASDRLRIYLSGTVCLEHGRMLVDECQFPARQGRLVFAYLVCERLYPVTRDELGEARWPDTLPPAWEGALSTLRKCGGSMSAVPFPFSPTIGHTRGAST
jgi:DNA-binding SARP family transcriptional activator